MKHQYFFFFFTVFPSFSRIMYCCVIFNWSPLCREVHLFACLPLLPSEWSRYRLSKRCTGLGLVEIHTSPQGQFKRMDVFCHGGLNLDLLDEGQSGYQASNFRVLQFTDSFSTRNSNKLAHLSYNTMGINK